MKTNRFKFTKKVNRVIIYTLLVFSIINFASFSTTHSKYFCGPSDTPKSAGACISCVCSAVQKTFWSQKSTSNSPLIFFSLSFGNSLLGPGCLQTNLLKTA